MQAGDCRKVLRQCRARLSEVLADWNPVLKSNPSLKSLGFAFVRRLARDSSILLLQPEDLGRASQEHKCLGCPDCCGLVWKFKTETVATLYAMFCECNTSPCACVKRAMCLKEVASICYSIMSLHWRESANDTLLNRIASSRELSSTIHERFSRDLQQQKRSCCRGYLLPTCDLR